MRTYQSGRRQWIVQFRDAGNRTRRVRIGDAGRVAPTGGTAGQRAKAASAQRKGDDAPMPIVALDAARDATVKLLAKVTLGADPQAEKKAARQAVRLGAVITDYLADAEMRLRPRSYLEAKRHLEKHAKPLREEPIGTIGRADVAALLNSIAKKNGAITANRVRASLSAMWTWGLRSGLIDGDNVVAHTPRPGIERQRERVLTDAELALIWQATARDHDHNRIVRLLMLTGCRREEVGSMAWPEIDGSVWTLPRARSKNGLPHEVTLGSLALAQLPVKREKRALVFGEGEGGFSGWSQCKSRLDARLLEARIEAFKEAHGRAPADNELPAMRWMLHDLRRTLSTWLSETGTDPHIVEAVLNHTSGIAKRGVAGVYNKAAYREPKRAALARWEAHITKLAKKEAGATTRNVFTMAKAS